MNHGITVADIGDRFHAGRIHVIPPSTTLCIAGLNRSVFLASARDTVERSCWFFVLSDRLASLFGFLAFLAFDDWGRLIPLGVPFWPQHSVASHATRLLLSPA
jgi:hypothetical protein